MIDLVLDCESFTSVLRISLKSAEHFTLLSRVKFLRGNDRDLFLLVELLVQLLVLAGNFLNVYETLIFG